MVKTHTDCEPRTLNQTPAEWRGVGGYPSVFFARPVEYGAMARKELLIKLIVRHVRSNKFLRTTGRWTKKAEAASNFPNVLNAIHACLGKGLKDVELILRYQGEARDRRYPLNLSGAPATAHDSQR